MYQGGDPHHDLEEVLRRQEELRVQARWEHEARRASRTPRRRSPAAFRFWRLHVTFWIEDPRS